MVGIQERFVIKSGYNGACTLVYKGMNCLKVMTLGWFPTHRNELLEISYLCLKWKAHKVNFMNLSSKYIISFEKLTLT
jgi:hypothetical protein